MFHILADVEWQKKRVRVGSERRGKAKKGVSSILQIFPGTFSISLYGRCFIQALQTRKTELLTRTKEAGAKIQDAGSRIWTVYLRIDEMKGIDAIWLPNSPGTPGPGHSRTGTVPGNKTEACFFISWLLNIVMQLKWLHLDYFLALNEINSAWPCQTYSNVITQ